MGRPTIQTKMSLVTTGIYCTISPPLSGDGRLFHSPGPAAANALSPKVLYVRVTTHACRQLAQLNRDHMQ